MRLPPTALSTGPVLLATIAGSAATNSICNSAPHELVPDGCASYGSLEQLNARLQPLVQALTHDTDYFSYYRLDLYGRTCPFWSDDGTCANIACAVTTIEREDDIPPVWRAEELSKLARPARLADGTAESCVVEADECDERDYCVPEDETRGGPGDYVSLVDNPERFTGYAGAGAANVWTSIYRENCFSVSRLLRQQQQPLLHLQATAAKKGFADVLHDKRAHQLVGAALRDDEQAGDDECLEKRVFYRLISGMHASISLHLCWDHLNQTSGQWGPSLDCFVNRFRRHPERLQNVYFNYALLLRAVAKLRPFLPQHTFCAADPTQDGLARAKLLELASAVPSRPAVFDESALFRGDAEGGLKQDFRNRFRNVSRVMDCVGCDKCRLWGKVQTQGYGTALKVLFEFDDDAAAASAAASANRPVLRRTEMVALVNTLARVSHSLAVLPQFQLMWEERNRTSTSSPATTSSTTTSPSSSSSASTPLPVHDPSFSELFRAEWDAVWGAFYFVLRSWYELPKLLFTVGLQEARNLWDRVYGRQAAEPLYEWRRGKTEV